MPVNVPAGPRADAEQVAGPEAGDAPPDPTGQGAEQGRGKQDFLPPQDPNPISERPQKGHLKKGCSWPLPSEFHNSCAAQNALPRAGEMTRGNTPSSSRGTATPGSFLLPRLWPCAACNAALCTPARAASSETGFFHAGNSNISHFLCSVLFWF